MGEGHGIESVYVEGGEALSSLFCLLSLHMARGRVGHASARLSPD
jgi:hypothetical protein